MAMADTAVNPHWGSAAGKDADDPAYVEVNGVQLGYRNKKTGEYTFACADLDFSIARGEFVVIVGPSGCGKTTFLEALAGLVPVTAGKINLGGRKVTKPGPDRSLVFQNASLFPWRTVRDNVLFALQAERKLSAESTRQADALIELVGLGHVAHRHPQELSGGMKQRVNLARALVTGPDLLLLDEPFGALDALTRAAMQHELVRVWQSGDLGAAKTAVFVTHDVEEAVYLADRVIVFSPPPGRVAADIRISLPRPRRPEGKRSPEFVGYVDAVLAELHGTSGAPVTSGRPADGQTEAGTQAARSSEIPTAPETPGGPPAPRGEATS